MAKTAVIFPGQGAQVVGMGADYWKVSPAAREVYRRADDILGFALSRLCFEGPAERLNRTDASQPAIFVTSIAIWRARQEAGLAAHWSPQAMAGLSLGEYTALHVAGWIGFEDGLKLVAERGRLMQAAAEATSGGMVSIMGVSEEEVRRLCDAAAEGLVLAPANFNCPGQIVISGDQKACERALRLAESFGARAVPLTVAGAFHSPLMESAVSGLKTALLGVPIRVGQIGVVSNVSADYHDDPNSVRDLLREQVARPIRWQASVERLIGQGFDRFIEVGPGRVLTGLMRKINRTVEMINWSGAAGLDSASSKRGDPADGVGLPEMQPTRER